MNFQDFTDSGCCLRHFGYSDDTKAWPGYGRPRQDWPSPAKPGQAKPRLDVTRRGQAWPGLAKHG